MLTGFSGCFALVKQVTYWNLSPLVLLGRDRHHIKGHKVYSMQLAASV